MPEQIAFFFVYPGMRPLALSLGLFACNATVLVLPLVTSIPALGQHLIWPQFRGPDANPVGTSKRLPERWSITENVEWSLSIPGRGWSSPIVLGDRVFVTTVSTDGKSKDPQVGTEFSNQYIAELKKQGLSDAEAMERVAARDIEMPQEVTVHYWLYCLNLKDGGVIWKKEFHAGRPPGGRHRKNSFVSETPITDGKMVFVYVGNMGLYAFDLKGNQLWSTALEAFPIYLDFGTGGSPALHGDQLIILNDNQKQQFLASFDKRTGKQLWRTDRDFKADTPEIRSGWSTPYIWKNEHRTEIVTVGPGVASSYDLAGKELWRLNGISAIAVPSPFAYGGLLYVNGGQGRSLFAIRPGASGDISLAKDQSSNSFIAWSQPRSGTYLPTQVAYDGAIYTLTEKGILSRFDAKTGAVTYKSRIDVDAGTFTSSPWAYNGRIFAINEEGKTFVMSAGEEFKLLHANVLDSMAQASPAIAGDRLLVRTEKRLYSIRQK